MKPLRQAPGQRSGPTVRFHHVELPTERLLAAYTMYPYDRCAVKGESIPEHYPTRMPVTYIPENRKLYPNERHPTEVPMMQTMTPSAHRTMAWLRIAV